MSLLIPSTVRISRAINIGNSKEEVQEKISDLRYWKQWNEMVNAQGLTNLVYTDSSFSSEEIKVNRVFNRLSDTIQTTWKNKDRTTYGNFYILQITADTTVVQWYFDIPARFYPWEKFGSLILEDRLGPPMENSLVKLKKLVENN
jgi:hypothetical protein